MVLPEAFWNEKTARDTQPEVLFFVVVIIVIVIVCRVFQHHDVHESWVHNNCIEKVFLIGNTGTAGHSLDLLLVIGEKE